MLNEKYGTPTKSDYEFQHPDDDHYEHSITYEIREELLHIYFILKSGFPSMEPGKSAAGENIRKKMLEYLGKLNYLTGMLEKQTIPYYTGGQLEVYNNRYGKYDRHNANHNLGQQ